MSERGIRAEEYFRQGYNCAQSVVLAFADIAGLEPQTAAKLASSFGGGLSRLREVCGTVSGAALILGMVEGYSDPHDPEAKKAHYHRVQEFAGRFRQLNGSVVCRELLAGVKTIEGSDPEERTESYYKKRPCPRLVHQAADILDEMLCEKNG